MKDENRTKEQLIEELRQLRRRLAAADADRKEHEQTEQALRESRQMLQLVLDTIPVSVFWKDLDSRYLGCNRSFAFDAGIGSPEEIIGKSDSEMSWADHAELYRSDDRWVMETGLPKLGYEEPETTPNRGRIWVRTNKVPLRDAEGGISGVLGTYEDITERKRMEDLLRTSETRYRIVSESTHDWEYWMSPEGRLLYISPSCRRVTGYAASEFEDDPTLFSQIIHPDDLAHVAAHLEADLSENVSDTVEFRITRRDGATRWMGHVCQPVYDDHGKFLGRRGSNRDITVQKQAEEVLRESEERYRELVQNANSAIIRWKSDGMISFFNEYAQELFGYKSDEIIGQHVRILVPSQESTGTDLSALVQNIVKHPERYEHNINENILRDGSRVWMAWTNRPILDRDGQVVEILAVGSDITERMQVEEALRESEERMQQALRVSRSFTFTWTPETDQVLRSASCGTILGLRGHEACSDNGQSFFQRVHPDDRTRFIQMLKDLKPDADTYTTHYRVRRGNGTITVLEETGRASFDTEGRLLRVVGVTTDVTERVESEQALRESEARFRLLSGIASRLLVSDDPLRIVNEIGSEVMEHLDCHVFFNFLVDETAGRLRLSAYAGVPKKEAQKIERLGYGVAVCDSPARNRTFMLDEDIQSMADLLTDFVKSFGVQACACHPLLAQGRLIGMLSFGTRTRAHFRPEELDLMKTVTDQVASAMERKRLIGELQRARNELEERVRERTGQLEKMNRHLEVEVAERRDAQRLLREKNDQLESILSTVHFLIAFLDRDFNFLRVNDAYAQTEECRPEFFIGKNHFDLYPNEENKQIFQEVVEKRMPYFASEKAFEYSHHPERGTTYWDWSLQPVQDASGEVTGLVFCLLDVTERRRAQNALRESEALLRTVLDTIPVGVWITDEAGKISMANPAAEKIWGGGGHAGLDQHGKRRGWWADTGEPIAPDEWALSRAVTRGVVSLNEIVDIEGFDGIRRTILNSAFPIRNEHDEIVRAIVVNQDITELRSAQIQMKNSEERLQRNVELLQKVFDGISDPLIMLDNEGLVTMINKAAMDYYGAADPMEVVGKPCFEGSRGRDASCPECGNPFASAGDRAVSIERKALYDPGRVENVTLYPVFDKDGSRNAVIVRISDITQAKILERQILHNEKLAALGLVTSGIAHEINNPNSFIYFNLPILRSYLEEMMPIVDEHAALHPGFEVLNMPYEEFRKDIFRLLENMGHGSQRISKTIAILRSFVRKRDLEGMQQVHLKHIVDKVVALCHTELRHKVSFFETLVPNDLPPMVSDPEALEQVLLNLLINAIHACNKPESRVSLMVRHEHGAEFVIEVTDNGSGIEEGDRGRIFDPFFTTKSSSEGTGLGLYICHNHVTYLGGRIEVESKVGAGTTFRVVLPQGGSN